MYSWDRHEWLGMIADLGVSPCRRRVELYFTVYGMRITAEEVDAFLHGRQPQLLAAAAVLQ